MTLTTHSRFSRNFNANKIPERSESLLSRRPTLIKNWHFHNFPYDSLIGIIARGRDHRRVSHIKKGKLLR